METCTDRKRDARPGGGVAAMMAVAAALTAWAPPAVASLVVNRIVTVSAAAAPPANCAALVSTLAAITDASEANPYLVRLEPGLFDCTGELVAMRPYVDLEGAGRTATTLRFAGTSNVLYLSDHSELRHLTVVNQVGSGQAVALQALSGGEPRVSHVRVEAGGKQVVALEMQSGTSPILTDVEIVLTVEQGINSLGYGISAGQSAARLDRVRIEISGTGRPEEGYGIQGSSEDTVGAIRSWEIRASTIDVSGFESVYGAYFRGSTAGGEASVLFQDSRVRVADGSVSARALVLARNGIRVVGSALVAEGPGASRIAVRTGSLDPTAHVVEISGSEIVADDHTVRTDQNFEVYLTDTFVSGGPIDVSLGGSVTCAAVWDENHTFRSSSCP